MKNKIGFKLFGIGVILLSLASVITYASAWDIPIDDPINSTLEVGQKYWVECKISYKEETFFGYKTRVSVKALLWVEAKLHNNVVFIEEYMVGYYTGIGVQEYTGYSVSGLDGYYYVCGNDGGNHDTSISVYGSPEFTCDNHNFNPYLGVSIDTLGVHTADYDVGDVPDGWKAVVDISFDGDFSLIELVLKKYPIILKELLFKET